MENCILRLKITSFECPLLNSETLDSPNTHLTASTMLDFPQPLGPTIPVRPFDNFISAESTKDLNPESLIFVNSTSFYITSVKTAERSRICIILIVSLTN